MWINGQYCHLGGVYIKKKETTNLLLGSNKFEICNKTQCAQFKKYNHD